MILPEAMSSWTFLIWSAYFCARRTDLAEADAAALDAGDDVGAALELAVLGALDRVEHGHVDLLQGRGEDVRAEVGLVGVDADALDALLLGRVERAEAALAGHLEDDLRALRDLVERDLLALRLVDEVLRVAVQRLDARVGRLGARLVARDVVVDRRDLLAADARDRLGVVVLGLQAGEVAGEVARLLLLEEQALDVRRLALQGGGREVDDREVRRWGTCLATVAVASAIRKPDRDDQVVLLLGERRQVRDVVGVRLRESARGPAMPSSFSASLEALVGQVVERAVVQAADVGHEADLDGLALAVASSCWCCCCCRPLSSSPPQAAMPSASAASSAKRVKRKDFTHG